MSVNRSIAPSRLGDVVRPSLLASLLAAEAVLVSLHFATGSGVLGHRIGVFFNLDAEQSVGTWFSSGQLLVTGLVLWLAADGLGRADQPSPWFLRLAAAGFLFLSMDEAISIHEALSRAVFKVAPGVAPFGHAHSAWVVLYGLAAPLLLFGFWRQAVGFWRAYRSPAALGVAGAAVMLAGAVGLETLGYIHIFTGRVEIALEETLEMLGGTLMLCAAVAVKDAARGSGVV